MKIHNLNFVVPEYERNYDTYESDSIELMKLIPENHLPIIELGASIGVVSCILNKKFNPVKQIVVEANPHLIDILEQNKKDNNCNFEIVNKAFSYQKECTFYIHKSFVASSEKGQASPSNTLKITVSTLTLKDLVNEKSILIVDIEGTEIDLINNELPLMKEKIAYVMIEFHKRLTGKWNIHKAIWKLKLNGFKIIGSNEDTCIFKNKNVEL